LGIALLAWLLFPSLRLLHIGFYKCRRGRLLLFQFLDALVGSCQLLRKRLIFGQHRAHLGLQVALSFLRLAQVLYHLAESLQELAELLFQEGDFFFLRHVLSLSDKSLSEQYQRLGNSLGSFAIGRHTWHPAKFGPGEDIGGSEGG